MPNSTRDTAYQYSTAPSIYYTTSAATMQLQPQNVPQSQQSYSTGGPVRHPGVPIIADTRQYHSPQVVPLPSRPSSGAWTPTDDQTLMAARSQGLNWQPIQQNYFPTKTPNACRKRHERLMERRNVDDWDGPKHEIMAKEYMNHRREIWGHLAEITGEKWSVLEAKCMSSGLKNLQSAARRCNRRERLENSVPEHGHSHSRSYDSRGAFCDPHTDDSGIGLEDLEAEYSPAGTGYSPDDEGANGRARSRSPRGGGGGGMYREQQPQRPQYAQRLPSMDMGIANLINRPGHGRGGSK